MLDGQLRGRLLLQHHLRGRLRLLYERDLHRDRGQLGGQPQLRPLPVQRELGRLPRELQQQHELLRGQQLSGRPVRLPAFLPDDVHLIELPERLRGHLLSKLQRLLQLGHRMLPPSDAVLLTEGGP